MCPQQKPDRSKHASRTMSSTCAARILQRGYKSTGLTPYSRDSITGAAPSCASRMGAIALIALGTGPRCNSVADMSS